MGLLISINGVDFAPYHKVNAPDPLVRDVSGARKVQPVQRKEDHSEDFKEVLAKASPVGAQKYEEVIHENEKVSRVATVAKDLMSCPVITLNEKEDVQTAKKLLSTHNIRHLPVVNADKKIIGIVSDRDIALKTKNKPIIEIMSRTVIAAGASTRLQEIARAMVDQKISSVPILDHEQHLIGVVTSSDLLESVFKNPNIDLFV